MLFHNGNQTNFQKEKKKCRIRRWKECSFKNIDKSHVYNIFMYGEILFIVRLMTFYNPVK